MSKQPTVKTCETCNGDGCRKCGGRGSVWSDGAVWRECRDGVACGRFIQCETCPHVDELTAWKDEGG